MARSVWILALALAACSSDPGGQGRDGGGADARRIFSDAGDGGEQALDLGPRPDPDGGTTYPDATPRPDTGPSDTGPRPDGGPPQTLTEAEGVDEQTNGDFAIAEPLPLGSSITGAIGNAQGEFFDVDGYRFDAVAGDVLQVTLTPLPGSELQTSLTVADENFDYLRAADGQGDVVEVTRQLYAVATGPLVIYVNDLSNEQETPALAGGPNHTYRLHVDRVAPAVMQASLPMVRVSSPIDAAGALRVLELTATAGQALVAETFAVRLAAPSDVDTILILEDRTAATPVVADLSDDIDVANDNVDSRIDTTLAAAGTYRVILDHYWISGPDRSVELSISGPSTPPPAGGLVINEVEYDNAGNDTAEFIELYNGGNQAVALATLALVFIDGADETEYRRVDLSAAGASLPAGGYLVIAMNPVTVDPAALVIRDSATTQNGPDGLVLFDTATNTVLDALAYEGALNAATIDNAPGTYDLVEGTLATAEDTNGTNGTLARCPNGADTGDADTDWAFDATPTPGAANGCN